MRSLILVAALAAVSLAACGKAEEEPGLSVTSGDKAVRVGKDGVKVSAGGDARNAAPTFAPIYPGAKIESTVTGLGASGGKTTGGTASFSVGATPQQVIDFYRKSAENAGLTAGMDVNAGGGATFSARDEATHRMVQVMVSAEGGRSNVQLIWAQPRG